MTDESNLYTKVILSQIITGYYNSIIKNKHLNSNDKNSVYKNIHDLIYFNRYNDEVKYYLLVNILKECIFNNDINTFKLLVENMHSNNEYEYKVKMTLHIFLYFLSYKNKTNTNEKYQDFLNLTFFSYSDNIYYLNKYPKNNYQKYVYYKNLVDWEWEINTKHMTFNIEVVIREFFLFMYIDYPDLIRNIIPNGEVYSFYTILLNQDAFINSFEKYIAISPSYNISAKTLHKEIKVLKVQLLKLYYEYQIADYQKTSLDSLNKILNEEKYNSQKNLEEIKKKSVINLFQIDETTNVTKISLKSAIIPKPDSMNIHLFKTTLENFQNNIVKIINQHIITNLNNNIRLSYKSRKNKLDLFTKYLKTHTNFNTIITNLNLQYLSYVEKENYSSYQEISNQLKTHKVQLGNGYRIWMMCKNNNVKVHLKSIHYYLEPVNDDWIQTHIKDYKQEKNRYFFPIVNQEFVELNKSEIENYFKSVYYFIKVDIEIGINSDPNQKNELILFK